MTTRTSTSVVNFGMAFSLRGFDEVLPAGSYTVETNEERLEGLSFIAYRRVSTCLHLNRIPGSPILARVLTIDPNDLAAALARDRALAETSDRSEGRQDAST